MQLRMIIEKENNKKYNIMTIKGLTCIQLYFFLPFVTLVFGFINNTITKQLGKKFKLKMKINEKNNNSFELSCLFVYIRID